MKAQLLKIYYFVFNCHFDILWELLLVFICNRETFTVKLNIESTQLLNDYFSLNNLSIFFCKEYIDVKEINNLVK